MKSCLAIAVECTVSSVRSDPGHLAETAIASEASTGIEVSDYILGSTVPETWALCWFDHRQGTIGNEQESTGVGQNDRGPPIYPCHR